MAKMGSGQITLVDLTDQRPIRVDLATSLSVIQVQTGNTYTPDYTEKNGVSGQIIKPSIFFGQDEVAVTKYFDKVKYNCSDEGDGVDYSYIKDFVPTDNLTKSYVDELGQFHLRRNLNENISIEISFIDGANIEDEATGVIYDNIYEKIDLQIVNQESGYSNFIISEDGRYDFEDEHRDDIKLKSILYYGANEVPINEVESWTWYRSDDGITPIKVSNAENFYDLQRVQVFGHETFICETKLKNGLVFRAQVKIDDRTDNYSSIIQADGSTVLTPLLNQVSLECQIWRGVEEFLGTNSINIVYDWYYIKDNIIYQFSGDNYKKIIISLDGEDSYDINNNLTSIDIEEGKAPIIHLPKESITIYCKTAITENSKIVSKPISYIAIQYTSTYSVNVSPDTIFIPVNSDGTFRGTSFSKDIIFSLVGEDGQPLLYDSATSEISVPNITGAPAIHFENKTPTNETTWNITFTLTIDTQKSLGDWDSNIATINYMYLGAQFVKTFDIVKNIQGMDGQPAYTIDLTNSSHRFAGEERWAFHNQSTNFGYIARLGDQLLTTTKITVQSTNFNEGEIVYPSETQKRVEVVKGLYLTCNPGTDDFMEREAFTLSTGSETNDDYLEEESGTFWIDIEVKYENLNAITFRKMFNYGFTKTGNSYILTTNPNTIIYSPSTNSYDVLSINIATQYQQRGAGPLLPYINSKVLYSTDGENFIYFENNEGKSNYIFSLSALPMKTTSITFRLYSQGADISTVKPLDEETVPIVTSLDGAVIGGENLLKWTKEMPISDNKWRISSDITVSKSYEEGFACFNQAFTSADEYTYSAWVQSPKSDFSQDYLGQNFCLSFYIKINSLGSDGTPPRYFDFSIIFNTEYNETDVEKSIILFAYNKDGTVTGNSNIKTLPIGKWVYVYTIFTIPKTEEFNNYKYFSISSFLQGYVSDIEVKKFKLEKGSSPTDWSPAYSDSASLKVSGANLFINQLVTTVGADGLSVNLEENGTYTLSYQDIDSITSVSMRIYDPGISDRIITLPINTNYEYSFDINGASDNNNALVTITTEGTAKISYLKLEKGEYSGSWSYTSENIKQFIDDITFYYTPDQESSISMPVQGSNGNITYDNKRLQTYRVTTPEGKEVTFISKEDFANYIKDIYENNLRAQQIWTATQIATDINPLSTQIKEIRNSIEINANAAEPYIEIKTTADRNSIYLKLTPDELAFMENNNKLAYFKSSRLYVPHAQITNYLDFGDINANSFLRLKVTGNNGVGFIWVNG